MKRPNTLLFYQSVPTNNPTVSPLQTVSIALPMMTVIILLERFCF